VAVLGSSEKSSRLTKGLPPLRSRVDVVFGDPFEAGDGSGRRTRKALDEATVRIQKQLTAHLENARRLTGRRENAGRPIGH
jgi:1-acyl-sn-glycerol-3-phosphate acyltransferase